MFFNFVQQLPQYYREGAFKSESELSKLLVQFLQNWEQTEFTYSDFKNWYENIVGAKISYKDLIDSNTSAPIKDGTCLQQLLSRIDEVRDKYIISVILKSLITHKKVFVI